MPSTGPGRACPGVPGVPVGHADPVRDPLPEPRAQPHGWPGGSADVRGAAGELRQDRPDRSPVRPVPAGLPGGDLAAGDPSPGGRPGAPPGSAGALSRFVLDRVAAGPVCRADGPRCDHHLEVGRRAALGHVRATRRLHRAACRLLAPQVRVPDADGGLPGLQRRDPHRPDQGAGGCFPRSRVRSWSSPLSARSRWPDSSGSWSVG